MAILNRGEKVHIIERQYFPEDPRRHFVGVVVACTEDAVRLEGYTWVFDTLKGFGRRPEKRERVLYPGERLIINVIPGEVDLEEIQYVATGNKSLVVTDGKQFSLDVSEFSAMQ